MENITVKQATKSDIPQMYTIDVNGWHQNFVDEARGVTLEIIKTKYGKVLNDPHKITAFGETVLSPAQVSFVAKEGEQVVGWVNLENLNTPDISWLNIYIDQHWQGEGIGSLLMQEIISRYGDTVEIHIATPEKANLIGFYKKFGFVEYPVEGRIEGPGNLYMIQMKRLPDMVAGT